jgi:hypothetical protein
MKLTRSFVAIALCYSLCLTAFLSFPINEVSAQDSKIALQRGYRTGYSDGYMSGYRDAIDNAQRGFDRHDEYKKADRAYSRDYGALEDYQDGYRQGFENGYNTGFEKRSFDATLPSDLKKRGGLPSSQNVSENGNQPINQTISYTGDDRIIVIPVETELIVELAESLSTEDNKNGDKFVARVVSPAELEGATVEGRISKIQKPGRIKRRAEMSLSFDLIRLNDNRWSNYNAMLTEVLPIKGDGVRRVDDEGTVEGKSSIKNDSVKVGATTGTGAVIGAVAGGPVGAAVGAGVGAAFGVGAVIVERGKHIKIVKGQQLRIKTAYETQIR